MHVLRNLTFALVLSPLLLSGAASAAQMVVIGVSGVAMKPGDIVDGSDELTLPVGSSLTLIGEDGTPVQLSGPYTGAPDNSREGSSDAPDGPDVVGALARLLSTGDTSDTSLGAVRAGSTDSAAIPDVRAIPVGRSGDYCVSGQGATFVWRLDASETVSVTLRAADKSWEAKQQFAAGQNRLLLPPNFPVASPATFDMIVGSQSSEITLHRMPNGLSKPGFRAAWLVGAGCDLQAKALLAQLK